MRAARAALLLFVFGTTSTGVAPVGVDDLDQPADDSAQNEGPVASAHMDVKDAASYVRQLANMVPLPCREDLASLAQRQFYRTGRAAEVGVFRGAFSQANLAHWKGAYYAIDAWAYRPHDSKTDKNFKDARTNDDNYETTRQATSRYGARVHLVRNLSVNASEQFPDNHFDWIYLDALHGIGGLTSDLYAWWPKLRVGGLFSGDDYGDWGRTPFLMTGEQQQYYGKTATYNKWGVIRGIQRFAQSHGVPYYVTWMNGRDASTIDDHEPMLDGVKRKRKERCYFFPAWYLVKPPNH